MACWCRECMDEAFGYWTTTRLAVPIEVSDVEFGSRLTRRVNYYVCRRCGTPLVDAGTCDYCGGACDPDEQFCPGCKEDLEIAARRVVAFMANEDKYENVSIDDRANILFCLPAVMEEMREEAEREVNRRDREADRRSKLNDSNHVDQGEGVRAGQ